MATFYDVKNVKVQVITSDEEVYDIEARHGDGIKDDPSSESSSETIGSTGEKVVNIVPDESTGMTINLLYGSQEDKIFESLYSKFKSNRNDFSFDMVVRDDNIGETVKYTKGSFKKRKSHEWGNETGTNARSWELSFEKKLSDRD